MYGVATGTGTHSRARKCGTQLSMPSRLWLCTPPSAYWSLARPHLFVTRVLWVTVSASCVWLGVRCPPHRPKCQLP